jgi:hypothetical protein
MRKRRLQLGYLLLDLVMFKRQKTLVGAWVFATEHSHVLRLCEGHGAICHLEDRCHNSDISCNDLQASVQLVQIVFALQKMLLELILSGRNVLLAPVDITLCV